MSNLKPRVTKLESKQPPPRPTWKDFVTGTWKPSKEEWCVILGGVEEYAQMQAWAETFTGQESERIEHGEIDENLSSKLLNVPESLEPILNELAKVIQDEQLKGTSKETGSEP
jgi:hypothetical protein